MPQFSNPKTITKSTHTHTNQIGHLLEWLSLQAIFTITSIHTTHTHTLSVTASFVCCSLNAWIISFSVSVFLLFLLSLQ